MADNALMTPAEPANMTPTELPPQATGLGTLPGQAAAAADVGPVPSAEDALLAANFGDEGATAYKNLRNAGNAAPTPAMPTAPPAGMPPAAQLNQLSGAFPGANPTDLLSSLLMSPESFGNVQQGRAAGAARATAQRQAQMSEVASGVQFLNSLRANNIPPDVRIGLIQEYATKTTGGQLSPAQSAMIAHLSNDPNAMEHLLERIKSGDLQAAQDFSQLFSGDPVKLSTAVQSIKKTSADADRAVDEATMTHAKAPYAGPLAAATVTKTLAEAAKDELAAANAGKPTSEFMANRSQAIEELKAQHKGEANYSPSATDVNTRTAELTAQHKAQTQTAKEQATTTAATRTMKETAPKVRELAERLEKNLEKIQTGPLKSRFKAFTEGKIGAPAPEFAEYMANAALLSSLVMRMHVGARGGEKFMEKFDNLIGASYQSEPNMRATLKVIKDYADIVDGAKEGTDITTPKGADTGPTFSSADQLKDAVRRNIIGKDVGARIARANGWLR